MLEASGLDRPGPWDSTDPEHKYFRYLFHIAQ